MSLTHIRTENGTTTLITWEDARTEIEAGMGFPDKATKHAVRSMSAARQSATIEYRDDRKVSIRPATPEEIAELTAPPAPEHTEEQPETTANGRRIVTVKGKRYIVSKVYPAVPYTEGATWWQPYAAVNYWAERNGTTFGPTLTARENSKPGTVGAAIWAEATR